MLSGTAALIYEVVWLHLVRLTLGVSSYSLAIVLAVFMGGMALGSLLYAPLVSRWRHPLRVYALLEWGIGGCGLVMPFLLPAAGSAYAEIVKGGMGSLVVRLLVAATLLLPPTTLMGATLPTISRWVSRDKLGAAQLGQFYAANILGAVCGSLLAGLVLMQYFDARVASYVAAGINGVVGLVAWMMARNRAFTPELSITPSVGPSKRLEPNDSHLITAAIVLFCSGLTALAAEVVWTRLLTLRLGPTVYAFALVLAVFLFGLGLGSTIASAWLQRVKQPMAGLCLCQLALLLTLPVASTGFADLSLQHDSTWLISFAAGWPDSLKDLLRCAMTVLPSAIIWGASFPLAVASGLSRLKDQASTVGILCSANTLGAIVGALGTTFLVIPWGGSQAAQQIAVLVATFSAGCCIVACVSQRLTSRAAMFRRMSVGLGITLAAGLIAISYTLPPSPALFAYGREAAQRRRDAPMLTVREGVHTPIVVTYWPQHNNVRALHLAGKLEASDDKIDLRLERMLGHLPQFLCDDPKSVLVVGLGAGITAGTFLMDDRTESLTICELEPALPPITAEYFKHVNNDVLASPITQLVIDDGRHFLQTSRLQFDVISVDPIHPWVRGAAALYSQEFFAQCLAHLRSGGIVSYWVPMHSMTVDSVKSELATFCQTFPHASVWHTGGTMLQRHMLAVGSNQPLILDLEKIDVLTPPDGMIGASLRELQFESVDDALTLFVASNEDLRDWLSDAEINRDMSLRLEYLAGSAAYENQREAIFREVVRHRHWPASLFRGEESRLRHIREDLDQYDELEPVTSKR